MHRLAITLVLAAVACLAQGCAAFVPQAVKDQAEIEAKIHDKVWEVWPKLKPEQRAEAYYKSRRAWHVQKVGVGIGEAEEVPPKDMPGAP